MLKVTQKELRHLANSCIATDITDYTAEQIDELFTNEIYFNNIAFSCGLYGCNGKVLQGFATKELYVITRRHGNLFRF